MKRRRKEIQIFNLSAIDLFACTMAAFLMIAIVLLPHYGKNSLALRQAREAQAKAQAEATQQQQAKEDAEVKLGQGTMAFLMSAQSDEEQLVELPTLPGPPDIGFYVLDVDMIIEVPGGKIVWSGARGTREETGILGFDVPLSGGPNTYIFHKPKPGKYRVWVNLQALDERQKGPVNVTYNLAAIFPRSREDIRGQLTRSNLNTGFDAIPVEKGRVMVLEFNLTDQLEAEIIYPLGARR